MKDALQSIPGQEHAKRVLEVALVGNHSVLFVGPPLVGYGEKFAPLCKALGIRAAFAWPCRCGNVMDSARECTCDPESPRWVTYRNALKMRAARYDICCELPRVRPEDVLDERSRQSLSELVERAHAARNVPTPDTLEREARYLLEKYSGLRGLPLGPHQIETARRVAATIARLECCEAIAARHMAEAIQYCYRA